MPESQQLYYVNTSNGPAGPYTLDSIRMMVQNGQLPIEVHVCPPGGQSWMPLASLLNEPQPVAQPVVPEGNPPAENSDCVQQGDGTSLIERGLKVRDKVVGTVSKVNSMVVATADLHKLEGFSWKSFFGGVFRKHPDEEVYEIFQCGTPTSTPTIGQISNKWPTPWLFSRFLFFGMALFGVFWYLVTKHSIDGAIPIYCITSAFFFPLALYILFYELNIWRNVSMYNAVRCLVVGGVVALILFVLKGKSEDEWYLGPPVIEYCKLLAALKVSSMLAKMRMNRILPGMLMGCSVAVGFAIIMGSGDIFLMIVNGMLEPGIGGLISIGTISIYYFLEVVWCIITVGAFCKVQALREKEGGQSADKWSKSTMFDRRFIVLAAVPVLLHYAFEVSRHCLAGLGAYAGFVILGVLIVSAAISWLIVLRLIQNGIDQVREEKEALQNVETEQTLADAMPEQAP